MTMDLINTKINFWLILDGPFKNEKKQALFYVVECTLCNKKYHRFLYEIKKTLSCKCRHALPNVSSRLQNIYNLMKQRCKGNMPFNGGLKYYKDKNIDVCQEWKNYPRVFYKWALDNGYEEHLSLDRIDNNQGYCPENCRWVDKYTQARNRDFTVLNEEIVKNIKKDLSIMKQIDISKKYNISASLVSQIKKNKIWVNVCI
jgi:hypothetical protein